VDLLEQQLLLSQAQRKSPGLAAALGFFFPWAGAFYGRKIVAGLVLLVIDIGILAFSIIGIGIPFLLLFGFYGAFQSYKWAQQVNQTALARMVHERQSSPSAIATS